MEGLEDLIGQLNSLRTGTEGLDDLQRALKDVGITVDSTAQRLRDSSAGFISAADAAKRLSGEATDAGAAVKGLGESAASSGTGVAAVGASASKAGGDFDKMAGSLRESTMHMFDLPGPIGAVQDALAKLGPEGEAAALALGAVTIAMTALVGTLLAGAAAAITFTQEKAQAIATLDALTGKGKETAGMIEGLAAKFHMGEGAVGKWVKSLAAAGIEGDRLKDYVKGIASAQALMGSEGAAAAEKMIKSLAMGGAAADKMIKSLQEGGPKSAKLLAEMGLKTADLAAALGLTPAQFKTAKLTAEQLNDALNKALQKKGAGPLAELANTWPAIKAQLADGLSDLFEDMGAAVKPFMAEVAKLAGMFYAGGAIQSQVKPIIEGVYKTVFAWATKAVVAVRELVTWIANSGKEGGFFAGTITALKGGWSALTTVFGMVSSAIAPIVWMFKAIFSNAMVIGGLKTVFTVVAVAIGAVVVAAVALMGVTVAVAAAFGAVAGAVFGAMNAIIGVVSGGIGKLVSLVSGGLQSVGATLAGFVASVRQYISLAVQSLVSLGSEASAGVIASIQAFVAQAIAALSGLAAGAAQAASDFIAGLAGGIAAGAGAVFDAVSGLASGLLSGFTSALGIASPSKVMLEHGEDNIAGASAEGMERGTAKVEKSATAMGAAAVPKGGKGGAKKSGEASFVFNNCTFGSVSQEEIEAMMRIALEKMADRAGAGEMSDG